MFKFKAKTHISLSIPTKGGHAHISFAELTGGGSTYTTEDEAIAKAIRNHPKFGKLFTEVQVPKVTEKTAEQKKQEMEQAEANQKKSIKSFACVEDAKEYIADTFGISRSKLRTRADIEKQAVARGITIQWGDGKVQETEQEEEAPQEPAEDNKSASE